LLLLLLLVEAEKSGARVLFSSNLQLINCRTAQQQQQQVINLIRA